MKVRTNIDPDKGVRTGSKSVIIRNKKGETEAVRKKGDAYINEETLAEDRKNAAGSGTGHFTTQAAPRTGGSASSTQGAAPAGGTRKQVKASKLRVRTNSASPQAKRSARKLY